MKKKLWITSLLAALSITAAAGGVALAKQDVAITDAAENWTVGTIDNNYAYGTSFEVPDATVEIGGEVVDATATVTYPDGLTVSTENVLLDQAGVYTVTYRAVVGNTHCVEEKQFNVVNKSYLMQNEASTAEYGKYTRFGANSEGLLVRLAPNDTITFSQLMDVGSIESATTLFDVFITPDAFASYDFSKLVIVIEDALDPSYFLRFQLRRYTAEDRGYGHLYLDVSVNGQDWVGCESDTYRINGWGTPFRGSFSAAEHKGSAWMGELVTFAPDKGTCKLNYNPENMEAVVSGAHIANLNNPALFEDIWKGWPSGKARISMTAQDVKGITANFCIKSIFSIDFSKETMEETEAPNVTVSMSEDEMPKGQVGLEYAIPAATAFDFYSGVCDVKANVYRDYASGSPISVSVVDGKFIPKAAGWYTIAYTAYDAFGNEGLVLRNVFVEEDLGEIEVVLPSDLNTSATLGNWITLPAVTYTGDCGYASVKTTISLGDETYEITDGKFLPEKVGEWKVTYTVTDYIGRIGTAEYVINAEIGEGYALLSELILPKIFVSDSEYVLPEFYATDYSTGAPVKLLCDVVVTDKNGDTKYTSGNKFKPSVAENGDLVKISYQCNGDEVLVREVPAVLVRDDANGKINAKNYLYGVDIETSYKYVVTDANGQPVIDEKTGEPKEEWHQAGVAVIAKADSELCGWTFATPQLMNNFSILFEGIQDLAKFDGLKITLTDSKNAAEEISDILMKKGNGTTIIVGEESIDAMSTSIAANKQYSLSYKDGKFVFSGLTVAVNKTVNGEAFTGFSSNLAYVKVEMINAKAGARYLLRSVNEANLSRRNQEVFAPNFQILGSFNGNQSLNATFEISPAIANDVFAPNVSLSMTVTAPDGTIVVDNNGVALKDVATDKSYFVTLSQYGKYVATYTAVEEDWVTENPLVLSEAIFVIDEQKPQVAFTNATQTTAKVGDVITLPSIVYRDNVSLTENIRVVAGVYNPLGRYYFFQDKENAIKCAYEGTYKFIVMVFDEQGNMSSITHTVTVTKE